MKRFRFHISLLIIAVFGLVACSSSSDSNGEAAVDFTVSPSTLSFSADGGAKTVSVRSSASVTAVPSESWLTVELGTKSEKMQVTPVTVTAAANTTTSARTATLSIASGSNTATVSVTQAAGKEPDPEPTPTPTPSGGDITAKATDIARLMYPGWNLGNTFEGGNNAHLWTNNGGLGGETSWQPTKTTPEIIAYVKAQGFRSVRIPCAWAMGHITDASTCTIDAAWMARVKEVVNYCINEGLYVVLNDHWDGGWLENSFDDTSEATIQANSAKLKAIWTQIATAFRDYDEHLLFAGLNEPNNNNNEVFKQTASINALIAYEQAFIDAVRATGGNNAKRILVVQGPSTDIDLTNTYYDISRLTDSASGALMAEVHYYAPYQLCLASKDGEWGGMYLFYYWGAGNHSTTDKNHNANWGEEDFMEGQFKKLNTQFTSKGIPVIIGEYGAEWRFSDDDLHNASIRAFHKAVNRLAVNNGCIPFVWGTNYCKYPSMTIINRANCSVFNPHALAGIQEGAAAASYPY